MQQIEGGGFVTIIIFMFIFLNTGLGDVILRIDNGVLRFLFGV